MKLAIMQPYFFPYIGYFQAIHAVDKYILYDNLNYIENGWIHRNRFLVTNGKPTYLNAEIQSRSSFKKIKDVDLVDNNRWRSRIMKSLYLNYKKAAYFEETYSLVEGVIYSKVGKLSDLNYIGIKSICDYLDINTILNNNISKYDDMENRLSLLPLVSGEFNCYKLSKPSVKVIRVLEICYTEKADEFINAIGGQGLYDKTEFMQNGIKLMFVKTIDQPYKQLSNTYYPGLSIIDVLMNCGKDGAKERLIKYELI